MRCKYCNHPIRETGYDDVPFVHELSGNGFCDVRSNLRQIFFSKSINALLLITTKRVKLLLWYLAYMSGRPNPLCGSSVLDLSPKSRISTQSLENVTWLGLMRVVGDVLLL